MSTDRHTQFKAALKSLEDKQESYIAYQWSRENAHGYAILKLYKDWHGKQHPSTRTIKRFLAQAEHLREKGAMIDMRANDAKKEVYHV